MKPENNELEKMRPVYIEIMNLFIQWIAFILSFLPVSIMAYFVPVIVRTVIDFRTPMFFGWVSIHLYIALAFGTACGFWAKHRAQNKCSAGMERLIQGAEFDKGLFRALFTKSVRFGIELTIILTMACTFTASLVLRMFKEITWLNFAVILLICFGIVSIPLVWVIASRRKKSTL